MANLEMSADVEHRSRESKDRSARPGKLCRRCGRRKAVCTRYTWKRRVNRKRHGDLCFQCRRAVRDAARRCPVRGSQA